jgi:hypothetical protein
VHPTESALPRPPRPQTRLVRDAGGFATAAEIAGLPLPPEPKAVRDGGGE